MRGRPQYPAPAVEWVVAHLPGDGESVADIGAGTGALTMPLAERKIPVIAVEPVKAMIERCPAGPHRLRAAAGRLPFRNGALSGIVAATAFHWFAATDVLREFHRCLVDDAPMILLWNERDLRVPWVAEHNALVEPYAGDTPRFATMRWKAVVDAFPGFAEKAYAEFPNPSPTNRQGLVDRILSTSFIAALSPAEREQVRQRAAALAGALPQSFDYPYLTRIWCYRRR